MKDLLIGFQKELENQIKILRKEQFQMLKVSDEKLSEIFSKGLLYAEECKNLGFH